MQILTIVKSINSSQRFPISTFPTPNVKQHKLISIGTNQLSIIFIATSEIVWTYRNFALVTIQKIYSHKTNYCMLKFGTKVESKT